VVCICVVAVSVVGVTVVGKGVVVGGGQVFVTRTLTAYVVVAAS
jgi:hypothetical protein